MIVGGASGLVTPLAVVAFGRIGALSPQQVPRDASRPFDLRRDGFVLGEGGGAVVLERLDAAERRGARVYAEVAGIALTTNASSLTDPSPGGEAEARAMRLALEDARLRPEAIDYVAAHGTSTRRNDATETAAIKAVFGDHARRLAVSSNKGQLGHTISSAGIFNVLAAAKSIAEGLLPPTANYGVADPACDLDCVPNVARPRVVRAALANAFAFGGQNASVALTAP
jgi:3-oxoacyl-[acyl-carrier-protein] synthase II